MKITSRNLTLLLTGFLIANARAATPAEFLAAGDEALTKFDLDAAFVAYKKAYVAEQNNYEAAWKLARIFTDKATLNGHAPVDLLYAAKYQAEMAVQLNPNDSKGHTYLAIAVGKLALFEGGKRKVELSKEVKAEADTALKLNSLDDLAHHVLGVWNREMSELNWLLRKFAELLYGKFPQASLDESLNHLSRAAELAPTVVAHHVELGITFAAAKRWADSAKELRTAIDMPMTWVTDPHYKSLAQQTLTRVQPNLK